MQRLALAFPLRSSNPQSPIRRKPESRKRRVRGHKSLPIACRGFPSCRGGSGQADASLHADASLECVIAPMPGRSRRTVDRGGAPRLPAWEGSAGAGAGHAVNPSLGALPRHPCRGRSCPGTREPLCTDGRFGGTQGAASGRFVLRLALAHHDEQPSARRQSRQSKPTVKTDSQNRQSKPNPKPTGKSGVNRQIQSQRPSANYPGGIPTVLSATRLHKASATGFRRRCNDWPRRQRGRG